uniref:RING-type domain-containing protein n=1 Tax=Manihot esculenta TaxID=3983 RepID=A0A251LPM5_MANES
MWNFASNCLAGSVGFNPTQKLNQVAADDSDDELSSVISREEGLECPICWESFNIVENVPYVLWCGHTLCKNCILALQWAVVKFPTLPIQLPLFISCPWCNLLSFRLVYRGSLRFPRKNYFLLWMVESKNDDGHKSHNTFCEDRQPLWSSDSNLAPRNESSHNNIRRGHHPEQSRMDHNHNHSNIILDFGRIKSSLQKSLFFFIHLTMRTLSNLTTFQFPRLPQFFASRWYMFFKPFIFRSMPAFCRT